MVIETNCKPLSELTVERGSYDYQIVKMAGSEYPWLAFDVRPTRCGVIIDGVAFDFWMCQQPNFHQRTHDWVISFADLEAIYLAAKSARGLS